MKALAVVAALVSLSVAVGFKIGQQQEVRTHAAYIESLNLK